MAFYRVPTEFLLAILCALTTLLLRFHGTHNACSALSQRSHCADDGLKTFVCTAEQLRHETMKVAMLKPSTFLQPWPDPKHSTPFGPPQLSSSKNDVNSVCSILELLGLHIGKQESSLLAYVRHSERNANMHISFL